jgi:hypothetical protein
MTLADKSTRKQRSSLRTTPNRHGAIRVADEVWIATALLHREHPHRADFTINEIVERARREAITGELRAGVRVYAILHCVANYPPNPGRYRVLYATAKHSRRLFREGDLFNEARRGSKITPTRDAIPARYHSLLDWYSSDYAERRPAVDIANSILALSGLGRELWVGVDPDEYVRQLREDWD